MAIAAETVGNKSDRACDALRARPCPSGRLLARRRAGSVAVGGAGHSAVGRVGCAELGRDRGRGL